MCKREQKFTRLLHRFRSITGSTLVIARTREILAKRPWLKPCHQESLISADCTFRILIMKGAIS
jgi:hypothetical protein